MWHPTRQNLCQRLLGWSAYSLWYAATIADANTTQMLVGCLLGEMVESKKNIYASTHDSHAMICGWQPLRPGGFWQLISQSCHRYGGRAMGTSQRSWPGLLQHGLDHKIWEKFTTCAFFDIAFGKINMSELLSQTRPTLETEQYDRHNLIKLPGPRETPWCVNWQPCKRKEYLCRYLLICCYMSQTFGTRIAWLQWIIQWQWSSNR